MSYEQNWLPTTIEQADRWLDELRELMALVQERRDKLADAAMDQLATATDADQLDAAREDVGIAMREQWNKS